MKTILPLLILCLLICVSCSKVKEIDPSSIKVVPALEGTTGSDHLDYDAEYDVVVYGGTMAGIMAAIEVIESGKKVILINPAGSALGGMTTNGLGITDVLNTRILGGETRDFYTAIKKYYSDSQSWFVGNASNYARYSYDNDVMIWFEPKAAQFVLRSLILKYKIPVIYSERLLLTNGVMKNAKKEIVSITMESGVNIKGRMFIDATYEGDLMAKSGVSYTYGRESNSQYGEINNGVQRIFGGDRNQFPDGIKVQKQLGINLPAYGSSDKKIQAYCFRMCLTNVDVNRVPVPKPNGYNEEDYEILFEYLKTYSGNTFFDLMPLPNGKTDSNNFGPFSTDYVGENYNYPEANYLEREKIIQNHKKYQMGLLWTLANHSRVPERIRNFYKEWGLPKDEFVNTNNWPNQLYIREGRRMIGEYVMTEKNCNGRIIAEKSVALGDYPMDSHIVQRYVDDKGNVKNEGQLIIGSPRPYQIGYGAIVPKQEECTNLFVPVCLSATHIAYGSIRMEPVLMTLGQVSGTAAVLALEHGTSAQGLPYEILKGELLKKKNVF
jgi:hypothetical protein